MQVRRAEPGDRRDWLRMRRALWPDCPLEEHQAEMDEIMGSADLAVFVALRDGGQAGGFLEASLRNYAEGCATRPVGYIEGWYVDPEWRQQGVGAALVRAAEAWAVARGCREMASDAEIENTVSHRAHLALGYEEVERLVHFRKWLAQR